MEMTTIAGERQKVFNSGTQSPAVGGIKAKQKAGIALLQKNGHRTEVLLVKQANGHWSLPKGKRKTGETIKQTGLRECREETGHEAKSLRFVGWGVNSRKHIRLYLWKSEAYRLSIKRGRRWHPRKREILRTAWFSLGQAQLMLKPWQASLLAKIMRSATNRAA
jgi:8-oxo-dGTP pyrophosphatase MutT (NUDIX family)